MIFLDLVEDVARKRPRAEALRVSTGARLTYGEVWASSEVLARAVSERAEPGEPVLVYGNKDPFMVVCFLACMKAGCPYVPIDCYSVPAERVAGIAGQVAEGWEEPLVLAVEEFPQTEDMPPVSVLSRRQLCDIVGKGGEMIKRIGVEARRDLERMFGCRVFLGLDVKVKPHWRDDAREIRRFGYAADDE